MSLSRRWKWKYILCFINLEPQNLTSSSLSFRTPAKSPKTTEGSSGAEDYSPELKKSYVSSFLQHEEESEAKNLPSKKEPNGKIFPGKVQNGIEGRPTIKLFAHSDVSAFTPVRKSVQVEVQKSLNATSLRSLNLSHPNAIQFPKQVELKSATKVLEALLIPSPTARRGNAEEAKKGGSIPSRGCKRESPDSSPLNELSNSNCSIFKCKNCSNTFDTAQALGGHMSRKHSGKSSSYNHKQDVRKKREFERAKLHLAKRRYFSSLGVDYSNLASSPQGKKEMKQLINRAKIKRIKKRILEEEVIHYLETLPPGHA